jgi:hypothetical protein
MCVGYSERMCSLAMCVISFLAFRGWCSVHCVGDFVLVTCGPFCLGV